MNGDTMTAEGALALRQKLEAYWKERPNYPMPKFEVVDDGTYMAVRSNMKNGIPQEPKQPIVRTSFDQRQRPKVRIAR